MIRASVNKIIPFSLVDGPGNRTSIFLQECNFNCLYCHNPETINKCKNCFKCVHVCKSSALKIVNDRVVWDSLKCVNCDMCIKECPNSSTPKIKSMTSLEIIEEIKKHRNFIRGITFSGGECTLNYKFIEETFKEAKKLGLDCFIDSNGSLPFKDMKELLDLTDKVMLDVKSYDSKLHKKLTGMDNKIVIDNLKFLAKEDKLYEVRTVVVPDILDNVETVTKVSEFLGKNYKDVRYKLIKYRPIGVRENIIHKKVPNDEYMKMLENIAKQNGCNDVLIV